MGRLFDVGERRGVPFWLGSGSQDGLLSGSGDGLVSATVTSSGFELLVTSTKPLGCSKVVSSGGVLSPIGCEATLFGCLGLVFFGGSTGDWFVFKGVEVVLGGASWGREGCSCVMILGSPVDPMDGGVSLAGAVSRVGVKDVG